MMGFGLPFIKMVLAMEDERWDKIMRPAIKEYAHALTAFYEAGKEFGISVEEMTRWLIAILEDCSDK